MVAITIGLSPQLISEESTSAHDGPTESRVDRFHVSLDGVNLLPALSGEYKTAPHENLDWRFGQQTALRQGDWPLWNVAGETKPRLNNRKDDIGEQTNLGAARPERVQALQAAGSQSDVTLVEPERGGWFAARKPEEKGRKSLSGL